MKRAAIVCLLLLAQAGASRNPFELLPFAPRQAIAYRTSGRLAIDGRLDEPSWMAAPWSDAFVDIEGDRRPKPRLLTRVKMLWDDEFFYVGADLEEPDLWGTFTERESIIFHENDFEVFIDPDGDTHEYYELEINALNTVWDLMLVRPYRDGGPAINGWDISGLKTGVEIRGTLNRPGDKDEGWSVEIAMPWKILKEAAPRQQRPEPGDQWRVNFSRVQWPLETKQGGYAKRTDAKGNLIAENNWVWSPQGAVAMHMPERWGYVQFSARAAGSGEDPFVEDPAEIVKWQLRRVYYRQEAYRKQHGRYARTFVELQAPELARGRAEILALGERYVVTAPVPGGGVVTLGEDGAVRVRR
jgi:hypothetical protein